MVIAQLDELTQTPLDELRAELAGAEADLRGAERAIADAAAAQDIEAIKVAVVYSRALEATVKRLESRIESAEYESRAAQRIAVTEAAINALSQFANSNEAVVAAFNLGVTRFDIIKRLDEAPETDPAFRVNYYSPGRPKRRKLR